MWKKITVGLQVGIRCSLLKSVYTHT